MSYLPDAIIAIPLIETLHALHLGTLDPGELLLMIETLHDLI